jgi:hypothetical protein
VFVKACDNFLLCRWITSFNCGVAVSGPWTVDEQKDELNAQIKSMSPMTETKCPWKSGTYAFEHDGKWIQMKITFFTNVDYGFGFKQISGDVVCEGIVSKEYFTIAIQLGHSILSKRSNKFGVFYPPDRKGVMNGLCYTYGIKSGNGEFATDFSRATMKFLDM